MSEAENDFPDYLSHNGSILSSISLLCGFLFSVIAMLVSNIQNFNWFHVQIVLLVLTAAFDLSLYNLMDCLVRGIYFCRQVPRLTKHLHSFNLRLLLMFYFFGATTVFLFLLSSLIYLALSSAIMWGVVVVFSYSNIVNPFNKYRNQDLCSTSKTECELSQNQMDN
jgi:hypothetical protein